MTLGPQREAYELICECVYTIGSADNMAIDKTAVSSCNVANAVMTVLHWVVPLKDRILELVISAMKCLL